MNAFQTYQHLIGKLNYALFLAMLVALPLPRMILQPIAVAFIISWVLELRFLSIRSISPIGPISPIKLALPGILLVCLTLWEALSLLWAPDTQAGLSIIERHWPFIILVLIPLFGFNDNYRADKVLSVLFASCVASVPLYLFTFYWVWNYDAVIWFDLTAMRPFEFPSFHGFTSLMKLRSYYCLILTLAIFSTPLLYKHYITRYARWEVLTTLGIGNAVMLAGMIMTGSRSALFILAITATFLFLVSAFRNKKLIGPIGLISLIGLIIVFSLAISAVVLSPRFSLFTDTDIHNLNLSDATEQNEPRLFIWKAVIDHADEYGFFGLGAGQHTGFLMDCYREAGNELFLRQGFGTHSQYLSYFMCLGPLAVLVLVFVFVLIPRVYKGRAHFSAHAFALLFAFSMLADDLLERMDSILIFLIWMLILYIIETDKK